MRTPYLMMRTKGLFGRVAAVYVGHRSSHPLAKSSGTSYTTARDPRLGVENKFLVADNGDQLTDDVDNPLYEA